MRNRIISMLLVLVMCASVLLTSCSDVDTGYEEDTSTIPAITLTLYGIKGEGTTDEAVARVQQELNRITEDKYKTTVELHLLSADEYDEKTLSFRYRNRQKEQSLQKRLQPPLQKLQDLRQRLLPSTSRRKRSVLRESTRTGTRQEERLLKR